MPQRWYERVWGQASALSAGVRVGWIDLLLLLGVAGFVFGVCSLVGVAGQPQPVFELDLSLWMLPVYTFYSLTRGLAAYVLSLLFTLLYGYWAAKDARAGRLLVPLLDILQSIPVLGFLPGVLVAMVALFPGSNTGRELAAILMIFTGQAWNMTFSFYHSMRSIPTDMQEVARIYRYSGWQRFRWLELPSAATGLVWNSMMSMAGGWFFLMIIEDYHPSGGGGDFRLPGLGSYMAVAVKRYAETGPWPIVCAILAMVLMIVVLDQLLWRPVVVWAQKFRVEESAGQDVQSSWFLNWLRHSRLVAALGALLSRLKPRPAERPAAARPAPPPRDPTRPSPLAGVLSTGLLVLLVLALGYGAWRLIVLLIGVALGEWGRFLLYGLFTLGRVLAATVLGTLWALPAGLAIGLSPRLSRLLQPVVQVVASFPAPMLYPLVIFALNAGGFSIEWGSILLMLLGTQWYILFNVIAGAMAIPADLKEAADSYRLRGWQRFRVLYFPAVFPYLVTGWVTAAGGAWNASIVSEFIDAENLKNNATGLGTAINGAADAALRDGNYAPLAASVLVMSALVVLFNQIVWRRFYRLAEERYSLNR